MEVVAAFMQTGNFNLQMQEIQHRPGAQVYFEAPAQDCCYISLSCCWQINCPVNLLENYISNWFDH